MALVHIYGKQGGGWSVVSAGQRPQEIRERGWGMACQTTEREDRGGGSVLDSRYTGEGTEEIFIEDIENLKK